MCFSLEFRHLYSAVFTKKKAHSASRFSILLRKLKDCDIVTYVDLSFCDCYQKHNMVRVWMS